MARVGIAAITDPVTTARYFERAVVASAHDLIVVRNFKNLDVLNSLDCLIICDPFRCNPRMLRQLACPVVGYMIDVHRTLAPRLSLARYLDHVFVAQSEYVDDFSRLPHSSTHWLPLACDRQMHFVGTRNREFDVGFVGKLGDVGSERRATLERVLEEFTSNDFKRFYDANDMGDIYSRSKIVFNKSIGGDLNMRFFEGLASGALLVTDRIGNGLDKIGREGEHYVTYESVEDAIEKIRYYLKHDEKREYIARRGQDLAFEHHSYQHRLATILSTVEKFSEHRAPARSVSSDTEAVWRSEHMMLSGANVIEACRLLLIERQLTRRTVRNSAIAVIRGFVRPLRQTIAARVKVVS